MDQTEAAVNAGVIAAPSAVVLLSSSTGLSAWIAIPLGLVGGFIVTFVAVYFAIEALGRLVGANKPPRT